MGNGGGTLVDRVVVGVVTVEVVQVGVHLGAWSVGAACREEQRVGGETLTLLEVGIVGERRRRVRLGVAI